MQLFLELTFNRHLGIFFSARDYLSLSRLGKLYVELLFVEDSFLKIMFIFFISSKYLSFLFWMTDVYGFWYTLSYKLMGSGHKVLMFLWNLVYLCLPVSIVTSFIIVVREPVTEFIIIFINILNFWNLRGKHMCIFCHLQ